jgi:hypothetical protein
VRAGCFTVVIAVLAGCAAAAGCGAGAGKPTSRPPASSRSAGAGAESSAAASARCHGLVRLGAGVTVPPWRLGAIDFLSPRVGVALTAAQIPCRITAGPGRGIDFPPQQVQLAVSGDGGRRWVTRGQVIPGGGANPGFEQVAATSARQAWALTDSGHLLESGNAGVTWTPQPLPAPVVDIAQAGAILWALSCPPSTQLSCRPVVERLASPNGVWRRLPVPRLRSGPYHLLDALSARAAVFLVSHPGSARADLASTSDAGQHWVLRPAPRGRGHLCDIYTGITSTSPGNWWLICNGSGAGGSSPKALMATVNAGLTWHTIAAVTSILTTPKPGSLPYQEVLTIAAGTTGRLWVVTSNQLAQSTDGGATWALVPGPDPQGTPSMFDVFSPRRAWLLAAGSGLWGTSNGTTWHPIGAAWPWLP